MVTDGDALWSRTERMQWQICLLVGTALVYASRATMPLTMVQVARQMKWSKTDSGTVLSCFFWGYTLTQVMGGYLSDTVGGDVVLITSALGWTVLTLATPFIILFFKSISLSLIMLVASRVILGALQGTHFPAMASLSSQYLGETERSSFFAVVTSGSSLGALICGSVGSIVLEYYGWHSVFIVVGAMSLVWAIMTRIFLMEGNHRKSQLISLPTSLVQKKVARVSQSVPWIAFLKSPAFWATVLAHVSSSNCWHQLISWLPTYFEENFKGAQGWVFNVVPWTCSFCGVWIARWTSDWMLSKGYSVVYTRKLMELVCQGTEAVSLYLLGSTSSYPVAVFLMSLALGASGFHHSGVLVNPQDIAPSHSGSVFGIMNMAGSIPGFVGVYITGHILEATHSWSSVFSLTASINILGLLAFLVFGTGRPIAM